MPVSIPLLDSTGWSLAGYVLEDTKSPVTDSSLRVNSDMPVILSVAHEFHEGAQSKRRVRETAPAFGGTDTLWNFRLAAAPAPTNGQ